MRPSSDAKEKLVVYFEVLREDNAVLFDHLKSFRKGSKRTARLRLLVNEGMHCLAHQRLEQQSAAATPALEQPSPAARNEGDPEAMALFDDQTPDAQG